MLQIKFQEKEHMEQSTKPKILKIIPLLPSSKSSSKWKIKAFLVLLLDKYLYLEKFKVLIQFSKNLLIIQVERCRDITKKTLSSLLILVKRFKELYLKFRKKYNQLNKSEKNDVSTHFWSCDLSFKKNYSQRFKTR